MLRSSLDPERERGFVTVGERKKICEGGEREKDRWHGKNVSLVRSWTFWSFISANLDQALYYWIVGLMLCPDLYKKHKKWFFLCF